METFEVFPVRSETLPPATHTNVYILGSDKRWVVDPGSPFPEENTRLLEQLQHGAPVAGIVLTHRHRDHVSGAQVLADALGCSIYAHPITAGEVVEKVAVDKLLEEGDTLDLGAARSVDQLVRDLRPCRCVRPKQKSADAKIVRELQIGFTIADHRRCRAVHVALM